MLATCLIVAFLVGVPLLGYYLDYRDRPQLFISKFKNLLHAFLSGIGGW